MRVTIEHRESFEAMVKTIKARAMAVETKQYSPICPICNDLWLTEHGEQTVEYCSCPGARRFFGETIKN